MPTNGETNIPTTGVIHVFFTEAVMNVNPSTFLVSAGANAIVGTVQTQDPAHWIFSPTSLFPAVSTIQVELTTQIFDYAGNPLADTVFSFQTGT